MSATEKVDLYKRHRAEYATPKKPTLVKVKPAVYLTIDGRGAPGGDSFTAKIGALYGVAFTIKMTSKFAGRDYGVCKLEGLWWAGRKGCNFARVPKDLWNWKLMIRTPDFIKAKHLTEAVKTLLDKGKPAEVTEVRLERIDEGKCVQVLHVGPYDREPETVSRMKGFAKDNGLSFHGLHHEIYLSDPRRVPPERLRTILRQPVK